MSVALSSDDRDRIARAARTLASPLAFETTAAWGLAVQRATVEAVGADKAFVHWTGVDDFVTETYSPADVARYPSYLPLLQEIGLYERSERLGVFTRREGYGPHYDRMCETEYVREFLPSVDAHDSLTIYVPASRQPSPEPAVQLLVHSSAPGRPFGARHVEVARRLRPAFVAGVAVLRQMARVRGDLLGLVDATGGPCAVFSAGGRLVHVSRALEEALAREPRREALLDRVRRLATEALPPTATAGAAGSAGTAGFAGTAGRYRLSASPTAGARPLLVVAVGVPPPPRRAPSPGEVAGRLGLTPRQSEVALLLAERYSNKEIAAALSVSAHTARHHVEAVLGRLGVVRAEVGDLLSLGRRVTSSPSPSGNPRLQ
ncbi:response regulator transcription factor [Rubrivirga sp.]|uniref:helix-turn-helix transcriptional regulator n=1 Tax=Rubrivirga sp. TaxID=1885344 RepID=UPI003B516B62